MFTTTDRESSSRISGLQLPEASSAVMAGSVTARLSVSQFASPAGSLAEDLRAWARADIHTIGLYRPKIEELSENEAIELIGDSGLAVSSLSWVGGFTGCDGSRQAEAEFDAGEAIRFASAVGARTVCAITGRRGQHIASQARRLVVDSLRRVCDLAGEDGLTIALHAVCPADGRGGLMFGDIDQLGALIGLVNRSNLGFVFDTFQFGVDERILARFADWGPLVRLVKLADRRSRDRGEVRRPLGDGSLPLANLVELLLKSGYQGDFEIDLWIDQPSRRNLPGLLSQSRERFVGLLADVTQIESP